MPGPTQTSCDACAWICATDNANSPIKLFKYMTGGKPTVTTTHECRKYSMVLITQNLGYVNRKLDEVLERTGRENTGDIRAKTILEALAHRKKPG